MPVNLLARPSKWISSPLDFQVDFKCTLVPSVNWLMMPASFCEVKNVR